MSEVYCTHQHHRDAGVHFDDEGLFARLFSSLRAGLFSRIIIIIIIISLSIGKNLKKYPDLPVKNPEKAPGKSRCLQKRRDFHHLFDFSLPRK